MLAIAATVQTKQEGENGASKGSDTGTRWSSESISTSTGIKL